MDETPAPVARGRRPSGREAKRAARTARAAVSIPYIKRKIPLAEHRVKLQAEAQSAVA